MNIRRIGVIAAALTATVAPVLVSTTANAAPIHPNATVHARTLVGHCAPYTRVTAANIAARVCSSVTRAADGAVSVNQALDIVNRDKVAVSATVTRSTVVGRRSVRAAAQTVSVAPGQSAHLNGVTAVTGHGTATGKFTVIAVRTATLHGHKVTLRTGGTVVAPVVRY